MRLDPGRVTATPQTNRYPAGAQVTLRAFPDAGQEFAGWSGDAAGLQNPLTITMDQSRMITGHFTRRARLDVVRCLGQVRPGAFTLSIAGKLGERYEVQGSADLQSWTPLATVTNQLGSAQWSDAGSPGSALRFYRAVLIPAIE